MRKGIEKVHVSGIVKWVFEDEACEPARAVSAFKKLSTVDGLSFMLGPLCGAPQKAIAPLLRNQKQILLLPNAAPSSVFWASGKHMYSVQYSLESEAGFLAEQMNERGLKKAAIVSHDNDFSRILEAGFLKSFKGSVAYSNFAPAVDAQYMKAAALKLKTIDFDSLFIPGAAFFLLGFLTELRKLGISPRPTFSNYVTQMADVLVGEQKNAEGMMYSYPDVPDDVDALGYFPTLAARMLGDVVVQCRGEYECVAKSFSGNRAFRKDGTQEGRIILKMIKNGHFVRVPAKADK